MKKKTAAFFCVLLLCAALTGCGSPGRQDADVRTCEQIADAVQQAAGFRELTDMTEKYMEKYLLVDAKDFDAWVMRRDASKATPEMVILLEVKEGVDQAAIKKLVQEFLDEQISLFKGYQPDQVFMMENARVLEKGRRIALIVSPAPEKSEAALGGGWQ